MSKVVRVAPKRRVERVRANIYHSLSTSQNDLDLHLAEDAKTLVRIKGQLSVVQTVNFAATLPQFHGISIAVNPGGVTVAGATVAAQALDQDPPGDEILQLRGAIIGRDATSDPSGEQICRYDIDTKAMRKLKPGDTIGLRDIVDVESGDSVLYGTLYMWFKE